MPPADIRAQLGRLREELVEAELAGLTSCNAYMLDLEEEVAECRFPLVAAPPPASAASRWWRGPSRRWRLSGRCCGARSSGNASARVGCDQCPRTSASLRADSSALDTNPTAGLLAIRSAKSFSA